jgi:Na+/melibiose symporter-like transporter
MSSAFVAAMKCLIENDRLDTRLETLLDQFESEVERYDKWSTISMVITPVGVILSILFPILFIQYSPQGNSPLHLSLSSGSILFWIISGILTTVAITKLPLFYIDCKKHKISSTKYRPMTGICMCDLSQLRFHVIRMEKSKTTGERIRHARMINYYKHRINRSTRYNSSNNKQ